MKRMIKINFEEELVNELLLNLNINEKFVTNKLKKELIKSFKKQNFNLYNEKRNEYFDSIHPF